MRCLVQAGLGSLLLSFIKSDVNKTSPISNEANSFNLQRRPYRSNQSNHDGSGFTLPAGEKLG